MALEIERRFLVSNDYVPTSSAAAVAMRACYLHAESGMTIRVRLEGETAVITLKQRNSAVERTEFEYPIPVEDALYIMEHFPLQGSVVCKTRYFEMYGGREWVVDIFEGENAPLRIAEVELEDAAAAVAIPEWAAVEITGDDSYSNAALAQHPFGVRGR